MTSGAGLEQTDPARKIGLHADLERTYARAAVERQSLEWQLGYSRCMEDTFATLRASEARGLIDGICGGELWPSGERCVIVGNHVGPHRGRNV